MKISKIFLIGVFFAFNLAISAQSQLTTGAISGTVQDTNGAIVTGATVTVINEETNQTRNLVTNDNGVFVAPTLSLGNYTVIIEKEGFSKIEQKNLEVNVGRTTTLRPVLQTGEVTAVVTIESTPIIDTVKTDESTLITSSSVWAKHVRA
ncbi:MAG: carboxypeptidase-like regulatory domain-containing protein, partial [Acidobacteriota bacterium]